QDDLVEARPLVGAELLKVRRRAGRYQPFAMTLRAVFCIDVPTGIGCGLGSSRCDMRKQSGADEKTYAQDIMHVNGCAMRCDRTHAHGRAKTKIELCPRTAFGMLFWVRLRGPAETD